jgi:hypothetical protein
MKYYYRRSFFFIGYLFLIVLALRYNFVLIVTIVVCSCNLACSPIARIFLAELDILALPYD